MENNILLSPIPLEQLTGLLSTIVRQEIRTKKEEDLQEKFLAPAEVCALFQPKISIATLNNWANQGLVNKHHLGKLTFYKYSEIVGSLQSLKRYQRQPAYSTSNV